MRPGSRPLVRDTSAARAGDHPPRDSRPGARRSRPRPCRPLRRDRPVAPALERRCCRPPVRRRRPPCLGGPQRTVALRGEAGVLRQRDIRGESAGRHLHRRGDQRVRLPCLPRDRGSEAWPHGDGRRQPHEVCRPCCERLVFLRRPHSHSTDEGRRSGDLDPGRRRGRSHRQSRADGQHRRHALRPAGVGQGRPLREERPHRHLGSGRPEDRSARPHHPPQPERTDPSVAGSLFHVPRRVRGITSPGRRLRLRSPGGTVQRPARSRCRRAVRPRRLHRDPAERGAADRAVVTGT